MATGEDFGDLASFLLGEKNNWITGQIFHIDGGRSTLRIKSWNISIIYNIYFFFIINKCFNAFPIPDDNEVSFDVLRKNKIIGNLTTKFIKDKENIVLHSVLDINVKILFIPAYKFFQETKETWSNGEFISIDGFTDFEDDREYKIDGKDVDGFFRVTGMDGLIRIRWKNYSS